MDKNTAICASESAPVDESVLDDGGPNLNIQVTNQESYLSEPKNLAGNSSEHTSNDPFNESNSIHNLILTPDPATYSDAEITNMMDMIHEGNKSMGGMALVVKEFYGIFGFVSFTEGYYMILITKKSPVSLLGGNYIYHIDETKMVPISAFLNSFTPLSTANSTFAAFTSTPAFTRSATEQRYLQIFSQVDTSKNFYFSHTYDISRPLQYNLTRQNNEKTHHDMFVWNTYLLKGHLNPGSPWYLPIIHGFVDQAKISVYGHSILVTLIARRSRFFAGARFLKRGVNNQGYVANDVETEQIVNDSSTTMFTLPISKYSTNPGYTSFLQHRGSIPLFWSQDVTAMAAKPLIQLDLVDPFYSTAALHFNNLFQRYGSPLTVLNLVKSKEKTRREAILLDEFGQCVQYLNQFLPKESKIRYIAWDMARASKTGSEDVVGNLEKIGSRVLDECGIFHSGMRFDESTVAEPSSVKEGPSLQRGVLRTNCIDCLDRTNAAQFVVGKQALAYQLFVLGIIPSPSPQDFAFDSEACDLFNAMYHDHGDTIALQYGGSHLVNTMETYRRVQSGGNAVGPSSEASWTSHSRDMIETIKRYYSNSFTDAEKQEAMNLFLGNFIPRPKMKNHVVGPIIELWDLQSDFYLHHLHPIRQSPIHSYVSWFDSSWLKGLRVETGAKNLLLNNELLKEKVGEDFQMFDAYYLTDQYTCFDQLYSFRIVGTKSDVPSFQPRIQSNHAKSLIIYNLNIGGVRQWLRPSTPAIGPSTSPTMDPMNNSLQDLMADSIKDRRIPRKSSLDPLIVVPVVKQVERLEYESYAIQFSPAPLDAYTARPIENSVFQVVTIDTHQDFTFFTKYTKSDFVLSMMEQEQIQVYENSLKTFS